MKILIIVNLLGVYFLSFSAFAELRVVVNTWPPYVDENLPNNGLAMDIVETAFAKTGRSVSIHVESWPRVLEGVGIGVFDVAGAVWHTDKRAQELEFSKAYLNNQIKFMKRKDEPIKYERLSDLQGLVIGIVQDFAYEESFLDAKNLVKVPQNHILQNLLKLVQGEIDLTVGDERALKFQLGRYMKGGLKNLDVLPKPLSVRGLCIAVSKKNPQHKLIVTSFNKAIAEMKRDGSYDRIVAQHQH